MDKVKLNKFISKYFLNGLVESAIWHSNGDLSTKFVDDTKSLVGDVVCEKSSFPEGDFGINQTSKLRSLLGVVSDTITIDIKSRDNIATMMNISDTGVNVNYMLADTQVIPKVPTLKNPPDWDLTLNLTQAFIENFIKASSALSDVKEFAVITKNNVVSLVIGHANVNTTKVAVNADAKTYTDIAVTYFSATHLKEILLANKDAKNGKFEISQKGLAKITFHIDDFKSTYYLVSRQDINA